MRTHRATRLLFCLLVVFLSVTGCASQQPTPTPPAMTKVKLVDLPFLSHAPFYIAQEEGYFAEQGLDVEFVRFQLGSEAYPAFIGGQLDVVAALTSASILNAIAGGVNLKIVADKGHIPESGCDGYAIIARSSALEDGTITDVASLRGKTLSTERADLLGFLVEQLLRRGNLTMDDVEIVTLIPPMWIEALQRGTIDAILGVPDTWATRILKSGAGQLWNSYGEWAPGHQFSTLVFGPNMLGENRDVGERFMVAFLKGVRQYNEGKTERNLDILTKALGLEREELEQTCWVSMYGDGTVNMESILDFQEWAVEKGYVDTPITVDQLYDPSFIEYANQVLGPVE